MRVFVPETAGEGIHTHHLDSHVDIRDTSHNPMGAEALAVGAVGRRTLPGIGVYSPDWNIRRLHVVPTDLPVSRLQCKNAWDSLTDSQQHFVHHFGRASWSGSRVCTHQLSKTHFFVVKREFVGGYLRTTTGTKISTALYPVLSKALGSGIVPHVSSGFLDRRVTHTAGAKRFPLVEESPDILRILLLLFSSTDFEDLKRRSKEAGVRQKEWEFFVAYATCFLTNLGNYLAFGDLKIVPGISEDKFNAIVTICPLQDERKQRLVSLWERTRRCIYSLAPGERTLGFHPGGCSAYYSEDITSEEVELVSEWMTQESIEPWNTRIWRRESSGNYGLLPEYDLRIASALEYPIRTHVFQNKCVIHVVHGDFKEDLAEVATHLKDALPYVDNDTQRQMMNCFIEYVETGSIECHKKCQEIWLTNKEEILLEFQLGFIETYRDPGGIRAEFEGFVAIMNKVATEQFATLIEKADVLLPILPWPKDYEADKFECPAFSCIEIFWYANGTIPAGINLPNYHSVRQTHGSRNFCISNVVEAHDHSLKTTFLSDEDAEISKTLKGDVFVIQLAFHELLGHGSGKLFIQGKDGDYNFPHGTVMHPITDEAVMTCYGPGETWNSIFGQIGAAFEECRAECVGIYLSAFPQALEVFGHVGQHAEDVMYINWLMMIRAGILALEYYSLDSGEWRQAHMQARFAILRTLLEASEREGTVNGHKFVEILPRNHLDDLVLHLNREKIRTVGLPAIRELLVKLQVYKSTADVQRGKQLITEVTTVPEDMLRYRRALLANKRPRPMFVQMHTRSVEVDGETRIELQEFEPTMEGLVQSYVAHFKDWIADC